MHKYLEIDSTYRNRQRWPLQSSFEVEKSRSNDDVDPISDSVPIVAWKGNTVSIPSAVVTFSSIDTMIISYGSFQESTDYYTNAIITPPGFSIKSYKYLGSNLAEVVLMTPMSSSLSVGTTVAISDPTNLNVGRFFVPMTKSNVPENLYVKCLLYDETVNASSEITAYNKNTGCITISKNNNIPSISDNFSIRYRLPVHVGIAGILSTSNVIQGAYGWQNGSFIRILPSYPPASPYGEIRRIVSSTPTSATVYPPFLASSTSGLRYEVLEYTCSSYNQLSYSGTVQNEIDNKIIKLLNLIIPNEILTVGHGGYPSDYPYLYVRLTPRDSSNVNINCSNNPNSLSMLFRATRKHDTQNNRFIKFTGDDTAVRVRFNVDTDIMFQIAIPNGQTLKYVQDDTISPSRPNPLLQISCLFEVVRDSCC
jgi:hypothetical protein